MGATFKIKIRQPGSSEVDTYIGNDGEVVSRLIEGAMENTVVDLTGKMVVLKGLEASERALYLNAIFFQRVVSRTPVDEDYITEINERGKPVMHKADNDFIRDYWTASYNRKSITAKYLMDSCGCTFEKFNDKDEVEKIYQEFRKFLGKSTSAFFKGTRTLRGVHIENTHPDKKRYARLEYGEYEKDGSIKRASRPHGVKGGYSIQAPAGMYRVTEAEMMSGSFNVPTDKLMSYQSRVTKIKSKEQLKELNKYLKGKRKLTVSDIGKIARMYGV